MALFRVPSTAQPKNIGGKVVPPSASLDTVVPQKKETARSTKSTRRTELENQLELRKKAYEAAQTALAMAETEMELAQYQSEEELDEEFELERSTHVEQWVDHTAAYVEEPERREPTKKSDMKELADAIISATTKKQSIQVSPKIWDLPAFSGAPEDWLPFKRAFEDSKKLFTDVHNMARLRNAIKGTAKETVRSALFTASNPEEVITALERNFGKPEELVLAELKKIKELPRVGDTTKEICLFASRIDNAVATINALGMPHYLHSPELCRSITDKLPTILRYRWKDYLVSTTSNDEPKLLKMKKFLDHEADTSSVLSPPETVTRKGYGERRHPVHAVQEESYDYETETAATVREGQEKFCFQCEGEHWLTECPKFREATVNERWEVAKKQRLCFRCLRRRHMRTNCKGRSCKKCKRPHHTALHSEPTKTTAPPPQQATPVIEDTEKEAAKPVYATADGTQVYLKMLPVDVYGPKGSARILALLDEGSTVSLMDADIAVRIGVTGEEDPLILETVGGKLVKKEDSRRMNLKIKGAHRRDKRTLRGVRTVEGLKLSPQHVNGNLIEECSHLRNIKNELLYEKEKPAMLIGQDNWDLIVSRKIQKGKQNQPAASLTALGWVLHGCCVGNAAARVNYVNHCHSVDNEEEIEELIKRHFDLDAIGIKRQHPSNDADHRALMILEQTTKQLPNGRYETGLLWKKEDETLPNNYAQAHNRLLGVEKKLERNPTLKEEYGRQLKNLFSSGYAEEAPIDSTPGRTFYLPHFAVVHPQKGKVRIVFDAAARYQGKSLNDALLPGPDLLQSLFGVLLRFREGPVAVVADIKEMFLRIGMREADRDSLRFLWRGEDRKTKPKEYRMTSVIFGAASSPATAIYVKNASAQRFEKEHPEAVKAIVRHHYMDDYLQSFATTEEAERTAKSVDEIHKKAGFELRQWASNREETLAELRKEDAPKEKKLGEEKTLGMRWCVEEDKLAFNVGLRNTPPEVSDGKRAPTKREVTSAVMSTFDPMGLVAPVLIQGKKLMQDLWRTGVKWDEAINEEQREVWDRYIDDVRTLRDLKIARCLSPASRSGEMHTFVDASENTYATAVYWRTTAADGSIHISLMAGKARVAPTKMTSIPRLELQAALLGARLATAISEESDLEVTSRAFWSDSTTVLQWMKADPRRFKTFVAHRLAEIEEVTKPSEWRWVPTKENPADDATRALPQDFSSGARWFVGPAFLYRPQCEWPTKKIEKDETKTEEKKAVCAATVERREEKIPDPSRFSTWIKLLRTTARLFMFADRCRQKKARRNATKTPKVYSPVDSKHLDQAESALLRQCQRDDFQKEIDRLKKGMAVDSSSKIKRLDVILDSRGVLCLNSRAIRIQNYEGNQKLPVLIGRHRITQLLIEHYHRRLHHGSHAAVANELRQKFWIMGLRSDIRRIAHQCQWCIVRRAKPEMPPLGNLPPERLAYKRPPFTCTGIDYFGPMHVTIGRRREKRWGALFTCLTTRAIHIEMAASLSSSSMIMALRRMAARRGTPRIVYSDNGTNFVGADHELRDEAKKINNEDLVEAAEREGVQWKFIPPGAPNMGGAWERLIRSVKTALNAVLQERSPPEEVLHTLLTEVEHTVNSRPLTHLSADPTDEEALTPNHFLIGRSCGTAVMTEGDDQDLIGKANWKTAQRMADHFWSRWLREYLPSLMPRRLGKQQKRRDFQPGDIVIIADSSLPRNTWPRGVIQSTHPGPDGRTRIVDVTTKGGLMRRPTSRLIQLTTQ